MNSEQKQFAPKKLPNPVSPVGLAGLRVFVAEDEPLLLMMLEDVLDELGCKVVGTAARVSDALAFIASGTFDIALLDGKLADGHIDPVIEVLVTTGVPFVVASGMATSYFSDNFVNAVVLQKPYANTMLEQALRRALAQGAVQRQPR